MRRRRIIGRAFLGVIAAGVLVAVPGGRGVRAADPPAAPAAPAAPTPAAPAAGAPEDVLKGKGLNKVSGFYLLEGDEKLPDTLKALRAAKKTLDDDTKKRVELERNIRMAKQSIAGWEFEARTLNEKLSKVKDALENNQLIGKINALMGKVKEGTGIQQGWEADLKKVNDSRDGYTTVVIDTSDKLEALSKQYEALAADAEVKGALARVNEKAKPNMKLGPSLALTQNLQLVRKQRSGINSSVVTVHNEHNIPRVDVTMNGTVTRSLVLDSGASVVSLTADLAKALGMTPGANDPTIRLQLANGQLVEAKQMMIRSVRVGQFVVENVECAVLPDTLVAADNLLGGSFLKNFVYKLDMDKGELHLAQLSGATGAKLAPPGGGGGGGAAPAAKPAAGGDAKPGGAGGPPAGTK